jgi:hypothetical protein
MQTNHHSEFTNREIDLMRTRLHPRWVQLAHGAIWDWKRRPRDRRRADAAFHCVSELCRLWDLPAPAAIEYAALVVALRDAEAAWLQWTLPREFPITRLDPPPSRITAAIPSDARVVPLRALISA